MLRHALRASAASSVTPHRCTLRTKADRETARRASAGYTASDLVVLACVSTAAYALKQYYSTASAEQLRWALAPTASLVELFTDLRFTAERGEGFVSSSRLLVIAPACAGVNFFVIALLSLSFAFVTEARTKSGKALFVLASAVASYAAMVVVNATRISLGVALASVVGLREPYRAEVHRMEGVVIYLTALFVLTAGARASVEGRRP